MCNTVTSWCWRGLLSFLILKLKLFNLYLYVWLDLLDLTLHFYKADPPPMRLEVQVCTSSQSVLTHPRNCDGRFGVKWNRRGGVSPTGVSPQRGTPFIWELWLVLYSGKSCSTFPIQGFGSSSTPPSVVLITKVFCHNPNIASSLCSSHHSKYPHVSSYQSSSTILFFLILYVYIYVWLCACVCVCVCVYTCTLSGKKY